MNHYERLKVTPDAPPEVIRAAYRALAARLHPDRQGGTAGPMEQAHEQMVALNNSYLVLMDPAARQAYDATLGAFMETRVDDDRPASFDSTQPDTPPGTRVDVDWSAALPASQAPWAQWQPWIGPLAVSMVLVAGGLLWWVSQDVNHVRLEDRLQAANEAGAANAAALPATSAIAPGPAAAAQPAAASVPSLTPEQLAGMSNEELLAAVPRFLDAVPGSPPAAPVPPQAGLGVPDAAGAPVVGVPAATAATVLPPSAALPIPAPPPPRAPQPASPLAQPGHHPLDGAGPLALKLGSLPAGRHD